MSKYLSILCLLVLSSAAIPRFYQKVQHNTDPEAKCLDGSPSILYEHAGGDTKNLMIFFLGGGECGQTTLENTLESCYKRSKSFEGTSTIWPKELPGFAVEGYLSTDPKVSAFANWTKFFIPYCDGTLHQGYRKEPLKYKDAELYFRGGRIIRAHLSWINSKYDLKNAEKVILTGMSAGGLAVNLWTDYVKDLVGDDDKVYPISDSGVFLHFNTITGDNRIEKEMQNIYKLANVDQSTPFTQCNKYYPDQQYICFAFEANYQYIRGKYLILQSQYDQWTIPHILNVHCLKDGVSGKTLSNCSQKDINYVESYRQQYKEAVGSFRGANPDVSIWSIACSNHVYACRNDFYNSPHQKVPANTGRTVKDAIEEFVFQNRQVIAFDEAAWPANEGCAK